MSFLKKLFKNKKNPKKDSEYIKKNFTTLIDYWSGIIDKSIALEDGSKFSDFTLYNVKYLKYPKRYLEIACITAGKNAKTKKIFQGVRACYMFFGNFSEDVKDKIKNSTQDLTDLVENHGDKDPVALVNKIAKLPNDEKKSNEIFNVIQKTQMFYIKKFDELTKK